MSLNPGGIGWASGPASDILFENDRGELLDFGRPLGRLWGPGEAQKPPYFSGSHLRSKIGEEASKKAPKNRYRKNIEK